MCDMALSILNLGHQQKEKLFRVNKVPSTATSKNIDLSVWCVSILKIKNSNSEHFLNASLVAGTVLRGKYRLACGIITSMKLVAVTVPFT